MALTKVGPAGIGSTPGNGFTIGNSFLHATGLDSTNAKFTGIVTAQTFRVLGNFQVDGTTTTLDTEVTSVDKLEVAANNSTVGVAITQSGSGDILNLYDGAAEVFTVTDGGKVGIGTVSPDFKIHSNETSGSTIAGLFETNQTDSYISFQASGTTASSTVRIGAVADNFVAFVNGAERLRITSAGTVNFNSGTVGITTAGDVTMRDLTVRTVTSSDQVISNRSGTSVCFRAQSSGTDKFVVQADGKVVVGGTTTVGTLTLAGDGKDITFGRTQSSGTGGVGRLVATGNIVYIQAGANTSSGSAADLVFGAYGGVGEKVRITSAGVMVVGHNAATTSGASNNSNFNIVGNIGSATGEGQFNLWKRTSPAADNGLGLINFCGGTDGAPGAVIKAEADAAWDQGGDVTDHPTRLSFWTVPDNSSVPAERLRITSVGRVGIGKTNPSAILQVAGTNYQTIRLENTDNGANGPYIELYNNSSSPADDDYLGIISFKNNNSADEEITYAQIRSQSVDITDGTEDGVLTFHTRNAGSFGERLRITSSGKIGVGGAPAANWHSAGSSNVIQVGSSVLFDYSSAQFDVGHNYYYDGNNYKFTSTGYAARITFAKANGTIGFWSLGTGNADANAAPSEKMRITSGGTMQLGNPNIRSNITVPFSSQPQTTTPRFQVENVVQSYSNAGISAINNSADGYSPSITVGVSWSNSLNSNSRGGAGANWQLGAFNFVGNDGTNFITGAAIRSYLDGGIGANDMPARLEFLTTPDGSKTPAERMRIDSVGWLGLGQTAKDNAGQVAAFKNLNNTHSWLNVNVNNNTGVGGIVFGDTDSWSIGYIQYRHSNDQMEFVVNNTERLRIDSGGRMSQGGKTPTDHGSPNLLLWGADSTMMIASTGSTNNTSNVGIKFAVAGGSTGDYSKAGIFAKRMASYNDLDLLFCFNSANDATGTSTAGEMARIRNNGKLYLGPYKSAGQYGTVSQNIPYKIGVSPYGWANGGDIAEISMGSHQGTGQDDGQIVFKTAADIHSSNTGLVERFRVTSFGGVTFNGDVAAANALDDYEEGNYTPTLYAGTGTTEPSYDWRYGQYVKIGEVVHLWGVLGINGGMPSCSQAYIGNLPYNQSYDSSNFFHYTQLHGYSWASGYSDSSSDSRMFLQTANGNSNKLLITYGAGKQNVTNGMFGSTQRFSFYVTYVAG